MVEEHARPCPESVRYEDFVLETGDPAAQLEALRGVTEVVGNVSISGDVRSLEAMSCLTRVEGFLSLGGELETLEGLERLERVGGVGLRGDRLRRVDALSNLTTIEGDLVLEELPAIESLDGLSSVATLGGEVMIRDVGPGGALRLGLGDTLEGSITVFGQSPDLTPLTGDLRRVIGNLRFEGPSVERIDLSALLRVDGSLTLTSSEGQPMPSLASLERVGHDLRLLGLEAEDLSSLSRLQGAGSLTIEAFPSLRSLDGFQALRTIAPDDTLALNDTLGSGVGLSRNPQLADLTALSGVEHVGGRPGSIVFLMISGNPMLSDLSGTGSLLPFVDWVSLSELPALVDLRGWPQLPRFPAFTADNTGLVSLDGLSIAPGSWIRGYEDSVAFELYDNADLIDISAAIPNAGDDVGAEGFIFITGNANLSRCNAEALVEAAQAGGFAGSVALEDLVDDAPCD